MLLVFVVASFIPRQRGVGAEVAEATEARGRKWGWPSDASKGAEAGVAEASLWLLCPRPPTGAGFPCGPLAQVVEVGAAGTTRCGLELRPGAQVRGTVRGGGVPLSDARVTLVDAAGNAVATTRTGPDGAYAFSDLDTGAYTVIATGYPPRAASLAVPDAGVDDHDIELAHDGE